MVLVKILGLYRVENQDLLISKTNARRGYGNFTFVEAHSWFRCNKNDVNFLRRARTYEHSLIPGDQ